ncbi:MAG: M64 family metallopeptidase [Coprococcus sp.]
MNMKKQLMRTTAIMLALLLAFSGLSVPSVNAAEITPENTIEISTEEMNASDGTETEQTEALTDTETGETVSEKETEASETVFEGESESAETVFEEETETETDSTDTPEETENQPEDENIIGELELVYGEESLADEDALVLLIMGDGFTADEQDTFYEEAAKTSEYMMTCSPFDEFTDVFKIYALGVVSNESGARGDEAGSQEEAEADTCDTYFGAAFWSYGMQRLLTLSEEGEAKGKALKEEYLPSADYNVYIVNSTTYGGSGGDYCVASLNTESLEMMLHELGHTIAGLADEYYSPGYESEEANLTQESDPEKVRWSRFIGKNGIGVYDWGGVDCGWYIPHTACKMQYLGTDYPFCEVCKEELRKAFCRDSDITKLFFQTYADEFMSGEAKDMHEYFILRRGSNEITGDALGDALTLIYYDSEGNVVDGIPSEAGTYTVRAEFAGNEIYTACSAEGTYTINSVSISMNISSKAQDGTPSALNFSVESANEDPFTIGISYEGYQYYTYYVYDWYESYMYAEDWYEGSVSSDTRDASRDIYDVYYCRYDSYNGVYLDEKEYQSTEGPTDPGNYTVTITVYDTDYNVLREKSVDYMISFKTSNIVDNNDSRYYGASSYGNNMNVLIYGEGFTEEEQDKFLDLAGKFADEILDAEPFKETKLYFNFTAVNSISNESGIGTEAKDTFFKLTYDENGAIVPSYDATDIATSLGYDINPYYDACIIIVNDEEAAESSTYYYDYETYAYFYTIFAVPDENGMEYTARELLNHLVLSEVGYRAETDDEKAVQRLELLDAMYYDYSPVIISRAYDESFTEDGTAYDLTSYFHVYYGSEELADVPLQLTYYTDSNGKPDVQLDGAPSEAGTYHVLAETVPNDIDGWLWYVPEGGDEDADGMWIGFSRGWTTYTIQPSKDVNPDETDKPDETDNSESTVKPDDKNTTGQNVVKTGDNTQPVVLFIIMIGALAIIICTIGYKCRKRKMN